MCRRMQIKWLTAISQICGNETAKNQIHNHDHHHDHDHDHHHHHHKSLLLLKSPSWSEMGQVKGRRFTTPGKQWKSQRFPPMFHRKIYEKSWEICNIKWVLTFRFRSRMIHSIGVEQLNMHSCLFPWCKASRLRADGGVCGLQDHWTILRRGKIATDGDRVDGGTHSGSSVSAIHFGWFWAIPPVCPWWGSVPKRDSEFPNSPGQPCHRQITEKAYGQFAGRGNLQDMRTLLLFKENILHLRCRDEAPKMLLSMG